MKRPSAARALALTVIERVERGGAYASVALDQALARSATLGAADRALATELVYGVLRHRGRIDRALHACADRGLRKAHPAAVRALRLAAYQILLLDRVPAAAAIDEAVTMVSAAVDRRAAGFVNAVLRRLAGGGEPPLPDPAIDPRGWLESAGSLPPWLAARLLAELGPAEAVSLGAALLERPPQTVRANRLRTTRDELRVDLRRAAPTLEVTPTALAPDGLVLHGLADPGRSEAGQQGRLIVQDEGSQLVSHLLAPRPGERVLDLCAGRGSKTLHLAALLGSAAGLVAVDRFPEKLAGLLARARRGGCPEVRTLAADLTLPAPEVDALGPFDAVLLDAPCSGLGVLRRHPEAKWRIAEAELGALVTLQAALLDRAAGWVRPGGRLVYAVCTFTAEEGEGQVVAFLGRHPGFARAPLSAEGPVRFAELGASGVVQLWPHRHGCDGFTLASLQRLR